MEEVVRGDRLGHFGLEYVDEAVCAYSGMIFGSEDLRASIVTYLAYVRRHHVRVAAAFNNQQCVVVVLCEILRIQTTLACDRRIALGFCPSRSSRDLASTPMFILLFGDVDRAAWAAAMEAPFLPYIYCA